MLKIRRENCSSELDFGTMEALTNARALCVDGVQTMALSPPNPERAWLGVVSGEHAAIGVEGGWIQLNHGKKRNLTRMQRGDGFVFYSPTLLYRSGPPYRAFTGIGIVTDEEPWLADEAMVGTDPDNRPWRRSVAFFPAKPVLVADLAGELELTQHRNWGYSLRFGMAPLSPADFARLRERMTGS